MFKLLLVPFIIFNAYAGVTVTKTDGVPDQVLVEITGAAATSMYEAMLSSGIKASNKSYLGLVTGKNLSCYISEQKVEFVSEQLADGTNAGEWILVNHHTCAFIQIGGETEPNYIDGVGPTPGVTIGN